MDYDLFMGGKRVRLWVARGFGWQETPVNNCYNNVKFYSVTAGN